MAKKFDFLLNRQDTAAAMGVSTQAIGTWDLKPAEKEDNTSSRVYYDIREVIQYRLNRDLDSGKSTQSLQIERANVAKLQGQKLSLEVKKIKGDLVPADTITEHWENLFLAFRSKILAIPSKAAMVALNATSIEDVEEHLEVFLIEALEELSGDGMPDEYKRSRQESQTSSEATSEDVRERVGRQIPKTKRGSKRGARTVEDK